MKKLDRTKSYAKFITEGGSNICFIQNELHYDSRGNLVLDEAAKKAGFSGLDLPPKVESTITLKEKIEIEVIEEPKAVLTSKSFAPEKKDWIIAQSGHPYKTERVALHALKTKQFEDPSIYKVAKYKTGWGIVKK